MITKNKANKIENHLLIIELLLLLIALALGILIVYN